MILLLFLVHLHPRTCVGLSTVLLVKLFGFLGAKIIDYLIKYNPSLTNSILQSHYCSSLQSFVKDMLRGWLTLVTESYQETLPFSNNTI